jgi:hypothetical protein
MARAKPKPKVGALSKAKAKAKTKRKASAKPTPKAKARAAAGGCLRVVRTQGEVAQHFECPLQTVKNWRAEGMPGKANAYDLLEIEAWLRKRRGDPRWEASCDQHGIPSNPRDRKAHFEAGRAEIKLRSERGELIPRADHERELERACDWFDLFLKRLPGMSPLLAGKPRDEIKRVLEKRTREARLAMVRGDDGGD